MCMCVYVYVCVCVCVNSTINNGACVSTVLTVQVVLMFRYPFLTSRYVTMSNSQHSDDNICCNSHFSSDYQDRFLTSERPYLTRVICLYCITLSIILPPLFGLKAVGSPCGRFTFFVAHHNHCLAQIQSPSHPKAKSDTTINTSTLNRSRFVVKATCQQRLDLNPQQHGCENSIYRKMTVSLNNADIQKYFVM